MEFAREHGIEARKDEVGNVVMYKAASSGMEQLPTVVLQSHMDMVCEKNGSTVHDFDHDPITPYVDGEWVKAKGTTLGADDGIGMAATLAVLSSDTVKHGPVEGVFTVDEELGMSGTRAIKPDFFKGRLLLNLDSEDEGEMFIGCAGGMNTTAEYPIKWNTEPIRNPFALRLEVKGLQGGHSGDDINKGRGNAIKILTQLLLHLRQATQSPVLLSDIHGGNLRNAIAREASATIVIDAALKEQAMVCFNTYKAEMEPYWKFTEPDIRMEIESTEIPGRTIEDEETNKILTAIFACPHGAVTMSQRMPGMVETSTNLASVKIEDNKVVICTSQRSDVDAEKKILAGMVASVFRLAGGSTSYGDDYHGWAPNPESPLLAVVVDSYKRLFGRTPVVRSIHAGLECGLLLDKYPGIDMVSFGPTLRGVHSPDEKVEIKTVDMWWRHLLDILEHLGDVKRR